MVYGLVPYENSTYGSVVETRDLFANQQHRYPNVIIYDETYLPVRHQLLGHRTTSPETSKPIDLSHIKRLYSHPAAFGQCKRFIAQHMKGVECLEISSTSKAAEIVSQDASKTSAAIASKTAAKLSGLELLAEGIQDHSSNTTRFFFLRNRTRNGIHILDEPSTTRQREHKTKTLVTFTTTPGSLSNVMKVFTAQNIILSNFFSVPNAASPDAWQYTFFAEFYQKQEPNGVAQVNEILAELEAVTAFCKWHGSWPSRV